MTRAILAIATTCFFATTTSAGFIVTFEQSGANVVANGSGTINLTALTGGNPAFEGITPGVGASLGTLIMNNGPVNQDPFCYYGIRGPMTFGPSTLYTAASAFSGDAVGIEGDFIGEQEHLAVYDAYVSGSSLSDSATWDNTTISGLGLVPGTYTWNWGSGANADYFEVVSPASVPEPSSLVLVGMTIGIIAFGLWLRRRYEVANSTA